MTMRISPLYLLQSHLHDPSRGGRTILVEINMRLRKSRKILLLMKLAQQMRLIEKSPPDYSITCDRNTIYFDPEFIQKINWLLSANPSPNINSTIFNWSLFFITSPPHFCQS